MTGGRDPRMNGGEREQAADAEERADDEGPLVGVVTIGPGRGHRRDHGGTEHRRGERPGPDDTRRHAPSAIGHHDLLDVGDHERDQDGREGARGPVEQDSGDAGVRVRGRWW